MKGKFLKKLCAVGLAAFMLVGTGAVEIGSFVGTSVSVSAYEVTTPDGSFEYEENDEGGITIKKYKGIKANVVIPDTIYGRKVTHIGYKAFYQCSITSVTIPDTVVIIGNSSFKECSSLTSVNISDSVSIIYSSAFSGCSNLTSVTIPDGVLDINYCTFEDCSSLTSVTIPESVYSISPSAFKNCSNLTIYGKKGSYAEKYAKDKYIPFKTAPFKNTTVAPLSETVYGNTINISCKSFMGEKPYTYAVYYKLSTAEKWTVAQKYSENTEVSFKPKHAGIYNVSVNAKDATGKVKKVKFDITVNPTLKNTSAVSADTIKLGKTVDVTASSTGGLGKKVYEVYYKNADQTKWTRAQSYSENTSLTIKPKHTGTYTICVKAKDKRGKVVKKNLTVEVTK